MDAKTFDGEAISRADRERLASLDYHPLKQNPLYGALCPPKPDFGDPRDQNQAPAREAFHAACLHFGLGAVAMLGVFLLRDPLGVIRRDGERDDRRRLRLAIFRLLLVELRARRQDEHIAEDGGRHRFRLAAPSKRDDDIHAGARHDEAGDADHVVNLHRHGTHALRN